MHYINNTDSSTLRKNTILNIKNKLKTLRTRKNHDEKIIEQYSEQLKKIKSVHEHGGHKTEENMVKALKGSELGKLSLIKQVLKRCRVCQLNQTSKNMPKISTTRPKSFNEIVTVNFKINITKTSHILWLIDPFSRLIKGSEVKKKQLKRFLVLSLLAPRTLLICCAEVRYVCNIAYVHKSRNAFLFRYKNVGL